MPYVQAIFVGTGDLFASCLLGWMHKDNDLKVSGIVLKTCRGRPYIMVYTNCSFTMDIMQEINQNKTYCFSVYMFKCFQLT